MVVLPVLKLRLQESLPADPETGVEWSNTPFTYHETRLRLPSGSEQFTWKVMLWLGGTVTFVPLGATRVMVGAWLVTLTFQTNALVKLVRSTTTAMMVVLPVLKLRLQESLPADPETGVEWSNTPFTYHETRLRLPSGSEQFTWKVMLWLGGTVTFVPLGLTRVMVGAWLLTLTFQTNALVKLVRSFATAVMVVLPVLKLRLQESLPADPETGVEWSNTPFTYQSTCLRLPSESEQLTWKVMLWPGPTVTFVPLGLTRVIDGAAAWAATVRQAHNTVTRQATRFGRPGRGLADMESVFFMVSLDCVVLPPANLATPRAAKTARNDKPPGHATTVCSSCLSRENVRPHTYKLITSKFQAL
jgi:hypothetical protein